MTKVAYLGVALLVRIPCAGGRIQKIPITATIEHVAGFGTVENSNGVLIAGCDMIKGVVCACVCGRVYLIKISFRPPLCLNVSEKGGGQHL